MNVLNQLKTRAPINKQAAMIFQKAPWWAYPPQIEHEAKKVLPVHEWELLADIFAAPPVRAADCQITDRRGTRIQFLLENANAVITGYHRFHQNAKRHYWWAVCEDGTITTMCWQPGSKCCRYKLA